MTLTERFWTKVERGLPDRCWEWRAGRDNHNYGNFSVHSVMHHAHRIAYELTYGPIPDGCMVLHSCDNPPCCNPAHLRTGTHVDNMRDMRERRHKHATGPARQTCQHGHQMSPENTYIWLQHARGRTYPTHRCRACARERQREYASRSKGE
jgi:hypothetical protein